MKELFGSPWKRILSIDEGRKIETWNYLELIEGYVITRLTINFDFETQRLENKSFHIYESDAERNLENIKTRYHATFKVVELPWCGHTAPSEDRYIDEALGLTVSYRKNRKEVNGITWSKPSPRIISSIRDQCPKVTNDYKEL